MSEADQSEGGITIHTSGGGAMVETLYVRREVRAFALYESEVEHIGHLNLLASVAFAVASALTAYALGIYTNAAFVEPSALPPAGRLARDVLAPVLFVGAFVAIALGTIAAVNGAKAWSKIKENSTAR